MTILAIDTALARASVAVKGAGGKLESADGSGTNSHSEQLESMARAAARAAGVKDLAALREVVIGSGPGSFTGLRIGFAFAKGIAQAAGTTLRKITTLEAAAWSVRGKRPAAAVCFDARRGEAFAALFAFTDRGEPRLLLAPEIIAVSEAAARFGAALDANGLSLNDLTVVAEHGLELPRLAPREPGSLARALVELAELGRGECIDARDPAELAAFSPEYLRPVAAKSIAERRAAGALKN